MCVLHRHNKEKEESRLELCTKVVRTEKEKEKTRRIFTRRCLDKSLGYRYKKQEKEDRW